jgi:hypothetical protein
MAESKQAVDAGKQPLTIEKPPADYQKAKPTENLWTIMIYHSGESSLSEELVWSLKEMIRVGTPARVEVIALMDTLSPNLWKFTIPENSASRRKTAGKRGQENISDELEENGIFNSRNVKVDKNPVFLNSDKPDYIISDEESDAENQVRNNLGRTNLASSRLLRNFIIQTIRQHRATHYMLILSGHGHGMIGKTFLLDEGSGRFLSVPRLNWALSEVVEEIGEFFKQNRPTEQPVDPRIDILGFDSCGMLTAEISNLLKDEVKYIVGSQGFMQTSGWPYHLILDYLKSKPNARPDELAVATVERCVRYYADFSRVGVSLDMSVVELKRVVEGGTKSFPDWQALTQAIKNLSTKLAAKALEAQTVNGSPFQQDRYPKFRHIVNAVISAHWYAQAYAAQEYVDLLDFCKQLKLAAPDELGGECNAVMNAVEKVVIRNCCAGGEFQHSHGLSLYFPWDAADEDLFRYSRFKPRNTKKTLLTPFNYETFWGEFLWEFIYATRRKPREGKGELIFMPPPGYRDHRTDHYANLYINADKVSPEDYIISPPKFRDNPQTLRGKPQTLRDMPPGLRDNPQTLRDNPQTLRDNPQTLRDNPQTLRDNPQTLRDNPQTLRFGAEMAPFAKVKNPSMVYYDDLCEAPENKKKTGSEK